MEQEKIHLVLSSGGVKCLSYIGAIQKLYANNITIESVSSCSMGSVVGVLLCSELSIQEIESAILQFDFTQIKRKKSFSLFRRFYYPYATHHTPDYEKIITELLGRDICLKELKIPFSALALDIRQKKFLVYSSTTHPDMKVSEVLKIATSIPFLFEPYKHDKRLLIDAALATESPIWMAANNPGLYPIVVLKPTTPPDYSYTKGFAPFLTYLFQASTISHDSYINMITSRSIEISINCEQMAVDNFDITKEQIENLLLEGEKAMEQKLKEYNYTFEHIFDIEEIKSPSTDEDSAKKAESLANQMIVSYQNEIIKRNLAFVSYSRDDKSWLYKLQTALKPVERYTGIKAWDDTEIKPGQEWNKEIINALVATKVAIFLVTPNFLASDFIQEKEMKYFLEISKEQNVPILWIAVSSCNYAITPLNDIQCANNPERPLDMLTDSELNIELTTICKTIIDLMK